MDGIRPLDGIRPSGAAFFAAFGEQGKLEAMGRRSPLFLATLLILALSEPAHARPRKRRISSKTTPKP